MLDIGCGAHDITAFQHGVGMMGYVKEGNVALEVESPLSARAFVLKTPDGRKFALAVAEMCFVTMAVKQGVVDRLQAEHPELGYDESCVMLSATHTHSGPGGYSHYFFYNTSIPGFVPEVYAAIVDGLVRAIVQADQDARPAKAKLAAGEFAPDVPVAFNRSLAAYNANPDVTPLPPASWHLAVDREMTLLRFERDGGEPFAALNWFAVHATSVHNENTRVSPDNKGYAALAFEQAQAEAGRAGFVAAFAQGASGDVTPNFRHHPGKACPRGVFPDDFESARHHGQLQADQAAALFAEAAVAPALGDALDVAHAWVDFSNVVIPPDLANGESGHRTSGAAIGSRMLEGTAEGPGLPAAAGALVTSLCRLASAKERLAAQFLVGPARDEALAKIRAQGNKVVFLEMHEGKILGSQQLLPVLPGWIDPTIAHVKVMHQRELTNQGPWTPNVLPLQLAVIGELAIAAVPAELTTTAGRRLKAALIATLAERGVTRVVTACYSNAYSGYITTPEEYDCQLYEGASTHFGRWTLQAYIAEFRKLAHELLKSPDARVGGTGAEPRRASSDHLSRLRHHERSGGMSAAGTYGYYREALRGRVLPAALVDLDVLDANARAIAKRALGKPVRIASKSVRCVSLLQRILASDAAYRGVMAYHPLEAVWLAERGMDDLLIAYPFWNPEHAARVCDALAQGKTITAMVDAPGHVRHLGAIAAGRGQVMPLCIDLDMSSTYPGLHFGVRRSGLTRPDAVLALAEVIAKTPGVKLDGLMGYEAQIAGVPDAGAGAMSAVIRLLKGRSRHEVADRRASAVRALTEAGHALRFVNGGGTGSMEWTAAEEAVTEVAAGSGLYAPTLFDGYTGFRHQPAAMYAVEITRMPAPGIFTCFGGGYPASGSADKNKLPAVHLPEGARLLDQEGAGEVQTPVAYEGPETLSYGDPVFMRHAKAGELCERFNSLLLVSGGAVVDEVPTYRGEGLCFL